MTGLIPSLAENRVASNTNDNDESASPSNLKPSNVGIRDLPKVLSSAQATEQLHTLCEKFAILTERVQEETQVRQEAEKEIQRLKKIVEQHEYASPCSLLPCNYDNHDNHDMVREFEAVQIQLRKDLRLEKDKNEQLIRRALQLEREKKSLLQQHGKSHDSDQPDFSYEAEILFRPPPAPPLQHTNDFRRRPGQDNNTFKQKIQETLTVTIKELEQELDRKDQDTTSLRKRLEWERTRVKQLQAQHREDENQEQLYRSQVEELRSEAQEAQNMIASLRLQLEEKEQQFIEARRCDEELSSEIHSLQEINDAMEKRCSMLMRRFDSSTYALKETEELKTQVLDLEAENCALTQSIQELRSSQSQRDQEWKRHFDALKADKVSLESKLSVLQMDLQSATQRNDLLSEWMLVRNGRSFPRELQESIPLSKQHRVPCLVHTRTDVTPSNCVRSAEQDFSTEENCVPTNCSNTLDSDHSRIRELMARNRELQQRLQSSAQ
uniref:AlNc14C19G1956 protein n=1 Tax=Albugo laibachii Nc14 TaxID=890382 RepID=F0W4Y5_9STRA|nr:AlNc14C19G1956 [Albugo laibachii Nc14]|eukprot:CCA16175.1 AlNc14C19G1956 [Albugo laibachii Nc14]